MVDCEVLTEYSKSIIVQSDRLLLQSKNCDYTIEILFDSCVCRRIDKLVASSYKKVIQKISVKAIYGLVQMEVNNYLVVVTKASVIGQIYHQKIMQVSKVQFICVGTKPSKTDQLYITGMDDLFNSRCFYFSDDYDLTNSLEQFIKSNCSMRNKKLQYMFNSDWVDEFLKLKAYQWITGFISGYVNITFNHGTNNVCEMSLITRRDKRRQGMRFITRGCDLDGNTANTAQTELIFFSEVEGKQNFFSHVQLRGSMPFLWKQNPDLRWSPKCLINPDDKLNSDLFSKNYKDIKKNYENATMINLIDKQGSQKKLGQYFLKLHNQLREPNMSLIWFDFHAECKNMKYQNLAKLLDMISNNINNYGYFHMQVEKHGKEQLKSKKNSQKGIFRTNCMDCLDRTNVVQSVLARRILLQWLYKIGFQTRPRQINAFQKLSQQLESNFRRQWTENADQISLLYSGTPAMKTDFTATGMRTKKGALNDGYYGVKRYFLGNFYDARKQDIIDFSLSKIKPKKYPNQRVRHPAVNAIFFFAALIFLMPFIVLFMVNAIKHEDSEAFWWTILGTILSLVLFIKIAPSFKSLLVRNAVKDN